MQGHGGTAEVPYELRERAVKILTTAPRSLRAARRTGYLNGIGARAVATDTGLRQLIDQAYGQLTRPLGCRSDGSRTARSQRRTASIRRLGGLRR